MKLLYTPALILLLSTLSVATADVIGGGVYYDVGKISYSADSSITYPGTLNDDSLYCWVGTGANLIQYWQDSYLQYSDASTDEDTTTNTPNGTIEGYTTPTGTSYLEVYKQALKDGKENESGYAPTLIEWWMKGTQTTTFNENTGGYYNNIFRDAETTTGVDWADSQAVSDVIIKGSANQGTGIGLALFGNIGHSITCWGYETDTDGKNITALILTDTDDKHFGAFRVDVEAKQILFDAGDNVGTIGDRLTIFTDDTASYYNNGYNYINQADYIVTPENIQQSDTQTVNSSISSGDTIVANTKLTTNATIENAGITVGDEKNVIIFTANKGVSLSLKGNQLSDTGLTVANGGMMSLEQLTVTNYEQNGMNLSGKAYLHNGDVNISNNGKGITNNSYLEIKDGGSISITNNDNGGLFNKENAIISIRGNDNVHFSGNTENQGNDIYNSEGGIINIAGNESVEFIGNGGYAIVNKGEIYLSAETGKSIDFNNASIDSSGGTIYMGKDHNNRNTNREGSVKFFENAEGNGQYTTVTSSDTGIESRDIIGEYKGETYEEPMFVVYAYTDIQVPKTSSAEFTNVIISYNKIEGVARENILRTTTLESTDETVLNIANANIETTAGLTVKDLTMDTTSSIEALGANFITLEDVVITLNQEDVVDGTVQLADMFGGNFTFNNVRFDASGLEEVDITTLTFDLSNAYLSEDSTLYVEESAVEQGKIRSIETAVIPEPTTATLSILALVGLMARRRRG